MKRIYLASISPRRKTLLDQLGLDFSIIPSGIDETIRSGETPSDFIMRVAWDKARTAGKTVSEGIIIAADTVVVIGSEILQKPSGAGDAKRMLTLLSGRSHHVLTAVSLLEKPEGKKISGFEKTLVAFRKLTPEEIAWYIATGEPPGKAGAYAIQGKGAIFIEKIEGSFTNVVGLPLPLLYALFWKMGIDLKRCTSP